MYSPYNNAQSPFSVWQRFQHPRSAMPQLAARQALQPMPQAPQTAPTPRGFPFSGDVGLSPPLPQTMGQQPEPSQGPPPGYAMQPLIAAPPPMPSAPQLSAWAAPDAQNAPQTLPQDRPPPSATMGWGSPPPAQAAPQQWLGQGRSMMSAPTPQGFSHGGAVTRMADGGLLSKLAGSGFFGLAGLAGSAGAEDDGTAALSAQLAPDQKRRLQEAAARSAQSQHFARGGLACKCGGQ